MIHVLLGTKAQLIKMAPIMVRLDKLQIPYRFINTGQHQSTMNEILSEFGLRSPDLFLHQGKEIDTATRMLSWIPKMAFRAALTSREIFQNDRRGIVLVHGDTFSALLGAAMGRRAGLTVGHVESGLRSFNMLHPFPEELTRLAVFRLSHILFCPGAWAAANMSGMHRQIVDTGGNTLADAIEMAQEMGGAHSLRSQQPFALVSIHRYENIFRASKLQLLVDLLEKLSRQQPLLFVLHPPTKKRLEACGLLERLVQNPAIKLRPRMSYFEFVSLLQTAEFVISDGGSIQEECHYLGIPCLLFRKATERQEGLGNNVLLSNYDPARVLSFAREYRRYRTLRTKPEISASDIIVDVIRKYR